MKQKLFLFASLVLTSCASLGNAEDVALTTPSKPNIIIIYIDDLGYGDIGALGATGVPTPNIDAMAGNGLLLTDAHATSATCTPSRYSLLTGEYAFRSQAAILPGDAPALIRPGKPTLASLLSDEGYATAVVGKWHLGLGEGEIDWNKEIRPGPLEIGFDYAFLLPATGDRVPTVYVENRHVVGLDPDDPIKVSYGASLLRDRPLGFENPELLRQPADRQHAESIVNGISRIGSMAGGKSAEWVDEEFPDVFNEAAVSFIRKNAGTPFFLFYSHHDIHVPRLPNQRFQGVSEMGVRGDAIVQMDWMTGQIIDELETLGIADETLVIFTSDNGPVLNDGYDDGAVETLGAHRPAGPLRGGKYSAFEAGARVPTIVYWPGKIGAARSDALISQVDIYASIAELLNTELSATEAIDSLPLLDAWLGETATGRDVLFKESVGTVSLRKGNWKYIAPVPPGRGDPAFVVSKGIESGWSTQPQLYDLSSDPDERHNLAAIYPAQVADMQGELDTIASRKETNREVLP